MQTISHVQSQAQNVRAVRPLLIFTNAKVFEAFINGEWEAQVGLEASAKVGGTDPREASEPQK